MKTFIKSINEQCSEKHLWVLFGSNDREKWIPFQVASKKTNIASEIRTDFLCMTSFDEQRNKKKWRSYYHDSVMEIEYGHDTKCQKYGITRRLCSYLAVVVISNEHLIDETKDTGITKYQIKECELAQELEPLLWNPAGKEYAYLNSKSQKM